MHYKGFITHNMLINSYLLVPKIKQEYIIYKTVNYAFLYILMINILLLRTYKGLITY